MTTSMALDRSQLTMLRILLEQQRRFRLEQLTALERLSSRTSGRRTAADLEVETTLISGARSALADVYSALRRMDAGSYGRCVTCGEAVALERLEILPHAPMCMTCQRESIAA